MKKEIILSSPKIELINSEGPILVAYKAPDKKFYIFDQWKSFVAVYDKELMEDFISGNDYITDSKSRKWWFTGLSEGMTPPIKKVQNFINE